MAFDGILDCTDMSPSAGMLACAKWGRLHPKVGGALVLPGTREALWVHITMPPPQADGDLCVSWDVDTSNFELWGNVDVSEDGKVQGDLQRNVKFLLPAVQRRIEDRRIGKGTSLLMVGKAPYWAYCLLLARVCQAGCAKVMWSYRSQQLSF